MAYTIKEGQRVSGVEVEVAVTTNFVLMTAMPPTVGHLSLIRFASRLNGRVVVIVCTQKGEPFVAERIWALRDAVRGLGGVSVVPYHRTIEQDPSVAGFWDMWRGILKGEFGLSAGDRIVASETYGTQLAAAVGPGVEFMPFDLDREIIPARGTDVRNGGALSGWLDILPEFRKYIQMKVTIFGAESVGKTSVSRALGRSEGAGWLFEYARPYLLHGAVDGIEVTREKMERIWEGQRALQEGVKDVPAGIVYQDTDLFSTVGYWNFWATPEDVPRELIQDAIRLQSHLYVILSSDIPFESDVLRYGGSVRESTDQYWIDLCEEYELPYVVIGACEGGLKERVREVERSVMDFRARNSRLFEIEYDRKGQ